MEHNPIKRDRIMLYKSLFCRIFQQSVSCLIGKCFSADNNPSP
jgi:hypothetical protein